jgi:protein N-terminal methyltransferase
LDASEKFLNSVGFLPLKSETCRVALDNGAGIGRVTSELLISRNLFSTVDTSEPCVKYAEALRKIDRVDQVFNCKLEDLTLPDKKYSLIWNQWVLLYLSEPDLIAFLSRCKAALKPDGLLCLKENVIVGRGSAERDEEDNSVTRLPRVSSLLLQKTK